MIMVSEDFLPHAEGSEELSWEDSDYIFSLGDLLGWCLELHILLLKPTTRAVYSCIFSLFILY